MEGRRNLTTKQLQRLEKKKKKMAAFLEIAKLNDKDREAKLQAIRQAAVESEQSSNSDNDATSTQERSSRKRSSSNDLNDRSTTVPSDECIKEKPADEKSEEKAEEVPNKKPRLSEEAYLLLRQELKQRKKELQKIPRLRLKLIGENASLTVNVKSENRIPMFLSDIQHLLLYSIQGFHSSYVPTRWCHLERYGKVTHTVAFVVEGLSLYHFMAYESMFPHITANMEHRLEIVTPAAYGGSVVEDLAAVPVTGVQSERLLRTYGSFEAAVQNTCDVVKLLRTVFPVQESQLGDCTNRKDLPPTDKFSRTQLLLSLCQMVDENYPVPLRGELAKKYDSYVMTKDKYVEASEKSPMFSLDCEMCRTSTGELELTRISVVDENLDIIYDSLVKPKNNITDYLTRYSGITEEMLKNVTTTISDVQQEIKNLLPADAILVGQSLNCDLHSLKMMHPYIIDTSVIFNITGDRSRKSKLQTLVREFLGENIQGNKTGHCSVEDSKASMKLTKLKLANSIEYGDAVLLRQCDTEVLKNAETRNGALAIYKAEFKKYGTSLFKHITKQDKTAAVVADKDVMNEYSKYLKATSLNVMDDDNFSKADQVRLVIGESNKHSVTRASEVAMEHAFTLCHVRITEEELKEDKIERTFHNVNKWMKKLWKGTAMNGLACVIFAGQSRASNGACFLSLKTELPPEIVIRV